MEESATLAIFAESGVQIGTGHVMRCLALGQAWRRAGGTVICTLCKDPTGLVERVREEGFAVNVLPEAENFPGAIAETLRCFHPAAAVLDGYGFNSREQALLKEAGVPTLFLDDYGHASYYSADWVLNQNLYANPEIYAQRNPETKLLLGPSYSLLRSEFLPWISWQREIPSRASRILVTMGGSDAANVTSRIVLSLSELAKVHDDGFEAVVAVGSANPHVGAIRRAAEQSSSGIRIVENAQDMPALMAWADIAVAAAGGTALELCFFGVPSLLFVAAENQRQAAESLARIGAAVHAGSTEQFDAGKFLGELRALLASRERRDAMSKKGRELVDGLGSERVCAALMGRELRLRRARENDCRLLFDWANDPATRAGSFHPAPIPWEEHRRWLADRLRDSQCVLYIGETDAGAAVGQVRFQYLGKKAMLSVSVAPEFRGAGWGAALISFSIRALVRTHGVSQIDAQVKPSNEASVRLFRKSGFRQIATETIAGQSALRFAWQCEMGAHAA